MDSGRRFQRHSIDVYLRAIGTPAGDLDATIDAVVAYLDENKITPERFRGFSFPATRNAIGTALRHSQVGEEATECPTP